MRESLTNGRFVCAQFDGRPSHIGPVVDGACDMGAANAPTNCAPMNAGTSAGRIPENALLSERAIVMAGLANEVDAVNQYAAPIQQATIHGTSSERR